MRICLFFLITAFLMGCSSTGNQRQEPENQTLETILNRKSVRKYKDRPVEKEKIDKLIRAGMAAPSSRDRRPWEFIIVTDRKALDTMAEGLPFARMLKETRQAIVVSGDTIKSSNAWFLDCSAASQNLLLAAESMGLGAVWTAVYPYPDRIEIVRKELQLPDHIIPLNVIPVGYPMQKETPKNKYNVQQIHHNGW